ncbi:MAG: GvpL/GvpF family gas vesicle protein [Solirubrobacteraceae bacterium]
MIELLAITDAPAAPAPPVRAAHSGSLAALCAPVAPQELTADALWRREELIEQLMEEGDLLPVRFGTLVADEAAAARAVAERAGELVAALDRVRGAVELAVRAHPREQAPAARGSVRDYLAGRARRAAVADELHALLAALGRASVLRPQEDLLLRAAYLVDRDRVERFVGEVHRLQRAVPDVALICTGPWPPYSFADGGEHA